MTTTTVDYDAMQAAYEAALNDKDSGGGARTKYVDDGDHTAVLKSLKLDETEGRTPTLIWTAYFPKANLTEDIYRRLTDKENDYKYGILKDIRVLKLTPPQSGHPKELLKVASQGVGATVEVTKKTDTYKDKDGATKFGRKYYMNQLLSAPSKTAGSSPISNDEIPF